MKTVRRAFAAAAALGGGLALLAGSPYRAGNARVDVQELASAVARGEDHVDPLDLARWIRDRRPGLRVLDLRSADEFDAYHVPGAERLALEAIPSASFRPGETLVLCSEGGTHAAQAWILVRALGHREVYVLKGGLLAWLDEVMNPTIAPDASPAEKDAFRGVAEASRYFGGVPRVGVPTTAPEGPSRKEGPGSPPSPVARTRGRGC